MIRSLLRRLFGNAGNNKRPKVRRTRRLLLEHCEDRRVLATAVDDYYAIRPNTILSVEGLGVWENDSYVESWGGGWCTAGEVEYWCLDQAYSNHSGGLYFGVWQQIPTGHGWTEGPEDSGEYGYAFTFEPDTDYVGTQTFYYTLYDENGSDWAEIVVDVIDDPVELGDDEYEVDEDDVLTIEAPGVVANDSSPVDDDIIVSLDTDVQHGTLILNSDGSFEYTPDPDFYGEDSFVYKGDDGFAFALATVTITVNPVNDAPSGVNDVYSVPVANPGNTLTKNAVAGVLGNDSDADGDDFEVASVSGAYPGTVGSPVITPHGVVTLNADGSFQYTPTGSYHGSDSFSYTATDGTATSATVTVTIYINSPPEVTVTSAVFSTDINTAISGMVMSSGNSFDADGDVLSASVVGSAPSGFTLNATGTFNYTPPTDYIGIVYFTYVLNDGFADSNQGSRSILVRPKGVNDTTYTTPSGQVLTVNSSSGVLANDIAGSYTKTVNAYSQPVDGTVVLNSNGSFTYTPGQLHLNSFS